MLMTIYTYCRYYFSIGTAKDTVAAENWIIDRKYLLSIKLFFSYMKISKLFMIFMLYISAWSLSIYLNIHICGQFTALYVLDNGAYVFLYISSFGEAKNDVHVFTL